MHHDLPVRQMAAELFSQGVGDKGVASALGLPEKTVERWLYTYRALGKEALFVTTHKKYSHEQGRRSQGRRGERHDQA